MRLKNPKFILLGIILLAAFLRLVFLGQVPSGFIPEEVSNGWNAYSILKTGRDEWNNVLPLVFKETGGYKLALNSYLIVPSVYIFGLNEFSVRLPVAIAGIWAVYLTFVLAKLLWKKDSYALAGSFLLAINPWVVSIARYGVDVNWGIPLFLAGLINLLKAKTNIKFLFLAAVCFGLIYYTYFNYIVFGILFLVSFFAIERKTFFQLQKIKYLAIFILLQFLFLLPYVTNPLLFTRFRQATQVNQIGFINRINERRQACQTIYAPKICSLIYNKVTDKFIEYFKNWINHYSTSVFFLYGSFLGLSGMPQNWGFFYPFEFGLIVLGIMVLISNKLFYPILFIWFFVYSIPSSLASDGHIWRMLTFMPLPSMIGGIGLIESKKYLKKLPLLLGAVCVIVFFISRFVIDYFTYMPYAQGPNSYYGFRDTYNYLKTIEKNYNNIVIAPQGMGFDQQYIYYLFYLHPDPKILQNENFVDRIVGDGGWVNVKRIGNWHFVSDVRNVVFSLPDKTLLVTDNSFNEKEPLPKNVMTANLIKTIYYINGDVAFKILELNKNPQYKPQDQ
ncbi:MAG: hypothetical protein UR52_C0019G0004 [Candidatus Gottesmanbacteria bacterium GW2011_GWA1_34_13]|uniref:Glycosyltransferase RgtA/B/C/D-like domain-containing protein n=1 Tax=Candidatus Gottesmanbacteria bacterium GW2011_GWA1_34_13 TaxID=1618434 RepID=A0A0G0ANB2_9BACT|nr:MAG: hypothetical protein UR52_C0019G0004 [Candidatus Gottesmanbacteria bacterium GW2011_GWA1_34_13]